jgi:hypothetical protein
VHVDGAFATAVGLTPYLGEQVAFGHDVPGVLGEVGQQVEFFA